MKSHLLTSQHHETTTINITGVHASGRHKMRTNFGKESENKIIIQSYLYAFQNGPYTVLKSREILQVEKLKRNSVQITQQRKSSTGLQECSRPTV